MAAQVQGSSTRWRHLVSITTLESMLHQVDIFLIPLGSVLYAVYEAELNVSANSMQPESRLLLYCRILCQD